MAHVLVADDNPLSLHFFSHAIAMAGHGTTLAENGSSALALAGDRLFDLILLDARMPGLDGLDVLHAMRSDNHPNRWTPTVVTTAEPSADRNAMLGSGFVDVLIKPIGIDALHALIERHLSAPIRADDLLDDALAAEVTGDNPSIIAALRGLFAQELDDLPAELDQFAAQDDSVALLDRLHRLDASAGFCGAPALTRAVSALRAAVQSDSAWPKAAIAEFLLVCMKTRAALN